MTPTFKKAKSGPRQPRGTTPGKWLWVPNSMVMFGKTWPKHMIISYIVLIDLPVRKLVGLKVVLCNAEAAGKQFIVSRAQHLIPMLLRLQLDMDGEELTEHETALYDRQIRVWGADAQRRYLKELISALIYFCKNIVLAGVGSVTLIDDRLVTEDLLAANFLIPADENVYAGKSLAELCSDSLKDFNPMQSVNEKCRKLLKRIAFYTVDCRDSCGEIFVDLQNYIYSKKKDDEAVECHLEYPSFEEAISVPWKSLPRRVSKLYLAMRVIEKFEELEGRGTGDTSAADLLNVQKLRKELCEAHSVDESQVPDSLLERLLEGRREFPPVCAIIGGILGQEVIKAISGKGDPLKNFFFYDVMDGKGIIEDIFKQKS
ncbi:hypothetical protein DH2020_018972 [Rehmannia glutinosa]|uniref:Uncharacterized protein n=1 Tax=Rehmannia glutinosa TaxID=99300 RepID=A0ABR0WPI7_REHGL